MWKHYKQYFRLCGNKMIFFTLLWLKLSYGWYIHRFPHKSAWFLSKNFHNLGNSSATLGRMGRAFFHVCFYHFLKLSLKNGRTLWCYWGIYDHFETNQSFLAALLEEHFVKKARKLQNGQALNEEDCRAQSRLCSGLADTIDYRLLSP